MFLLKWSLNLSHLINKHEIISNYMVVYLARVDDFFVRCMGQKDGNVNYSLKSDSAVTKCLL